VQTALSAFVVVMNLTRLARATHSDHHRTAFSAENFRCEDIFCVSFHVSGLVLVLIHTLLNAVENFLWNNRWHTAGGDSIAVSVLADISAVFQEIVHGRLICVLVLRVGKYAARVEFVANLLDGLTIGITSENLKNYRRCQWVYFVKSFRIYDITKR